jgi:hypothetical protein
MLTGLGEEEWMTGKFQTKRSKIKVDRTKYSSDDLERYDCQSINNGGGMTESDTFEIKQYPFPILNPRSSLDIREYDKRIGD